MILILFIVALTVFIYMKNKQSDRAYNRRARLQEKQEELMESLKARKADKGNEQ